MMVSGMVDVGRVRGAMERRAGGRRVVAGLQVGVGIAATLVIPVLLATWMAVEMRADVALASDFSAQWWIWYAIAFVVLVPAAYFMAWQGKGGERLRELLQSEVTWGHSTWNPYYWRWDTAVWTLDWSLMLFAPRMVYEGAGRMHSARLVGDAHGRAAEALVRLLAGEHGVAVESLKGAGEDAVGFGRAVAYLVLYEWVGVSEDGGKIWVLTETREVFGLGEAG